MIIIPQSSQYHHYHHGKHNYRHQACSLSLRVKVWAAHVKIPFFFLHHRCTVSKGAIPPPLQSPTPQKPKLPPTHGNFWGPAAILQDFSGPTGANKGPKDRPPSLEQMCPRHASEMYSFVILWAQWRRRPAPPKVSHEQMCPWTGRPIWTLITAFTGLTGPSFSITRVHPLVKTVGNDDKWPIFKIRMPVNKYSGKPGSRKTLNMDTFCQGSGIIQW